VTVECLNFSAAYEHQKLNDNTVQELSGCDTVCYIMVVMHYSNDLLLASSKIKLYCCKKANCNIHHIKKYLKLKLWVLK
jgi:hypothetical protein